LLGLAKCFDEIPNPCPETILEELSLSAGSPADVSKAIQALQFTAVPNPAVPGYTITYVGMSVSDGVAPPVTAQAEVLTGLPIFTGVTPNQTVVDGHSITPFSTVQVTDSAGLTTQGRTGTVAKAVLADALDDEPLGLECGIELRQDVVGEGGLGTHGLGAVRTWQAA
jgi:hypothetical protein